MKLVIFFFLFALSPIIIFGQDAKLSGGIEMGLIKNWSTKPIDEVGIFINSQDYSYQTRENFQKIFVAYEKQLGVRVDFTKAIYSDLICAQGNVVFDAKIKDCSGTDWNAYQVNTNVYRKFYFLKQRMYLSPSVGAGFMWYGGDSYSLGNAGYGSLGGSLFRYYFEDKSDHLKNKNVILNSGMALGYKINPKLNLTLFYNFQQGIQEMYQIDVIAWKPDDYEIYDRPTDPTKLMKVQVDSRGSNSHFGLGLEYSLKSYPLKSSIK